MATVGTQAARALQDLLGSQTGVGLILAQRAAGERPGQPAYAIGRISMGHYALDLGDKSQGGRFPQMLVYCERIQNSLRQKFQRFSGTVDLVIEVRNSSDRIENMEQETQIYAEAVMDLLEQSRGEWRDGFYYSGQYEVQFEPVKAGGRNFSQTAKIRLPLEVNLHK